MQVKLIFTRKVVRLASFWKWGFLELGSGLWNLEEHTTSQEMTYKENECMINISKKCLSHLTCTKTLNYYEYTTACWRQVATCATILVAYFVSRQGDQNGRSLERLILLMLSNIKCIQWTLVKRDTLGITSVIHAFSKLCVLWQGTRGINLSFHFIHVQLPLRHTSLEPPLLSNSRSTSHVRGERRRREECGGSPSEEKIIIFSLSTPITPPSSYTFSLGPRVPVKKKGRQLAVYMLCMYTLKCL